MWRPILYIYLAFMFGWFAVCKMRNPLNPIPPFELAYLSAIPEFAAYVEFQPDLLGH
jgi:hypothetical protein